jgi:hypothetical protein
MTAKEFYDSTRMVETTHWTLNMAMCFAEEYHKVKMVALQNDNIDWSGPEAGYTTQRDDT